jgi:poly(3-hydroxybutyrate) depolymerase
MTVEGQRDEACPPGQTHAAHALCTSLPPAAHAGHVQRGAGHYELFEGALWEKDIYPRVRQTTHRSHG